ncbi:MAG TPA: hypothetical protein VIL46_05220, partial [Gemmataceae bacterium]
FSVAKPLGFNIIDDGPRSVIYSAHSQQVGDVDPTDIRADFVLLTTKFYQGSRHPVPRNAYFTDATEFNEQWRREVTAKFPGGYTRVKQQITKLTPYYARVDSYTHAWTTFFHTRELGPELVQRLLAVHPELKEKDGQVEPEKRMMKFRFYMQAGWYTVANAELDRLLKDAPQEKERVEQARKQLRLLMAEELLTATERARAAGQHRLAQQLLARFPNEEFNEKVALRLARLRGTYETENARFRSAQRFLAALPGKVGGEEGSFLAEAARTILGELNLDNVERLETFVTLAEQAERDAGEGRPVTHAPEQLLAAAVTGWLQGRNYTETKVESARRFWDARRFVLDYQRTNLTVRRRQMAEGYKKAGGSVAYDELAQLIRLLPPPEPGETASSRATAFAALASGLGAGAAELGPAAAGGALPGAEETMECRTPPVRWHNEGVRYFLRLPPEYHHGRAYPVLLVLHHANTQRPAEEHAEALLKEIAPHAARHGYILAAPVWTNRFSPGYEYSAAEHMTVIATLRDLRRHYQVDSDRVFLTGLG